MQLETEPVPRRTRLPRGGPSARSTTGSGAAIPAFDAGVAYEMLTFLGDDVREGGQAITERRATRFGK